jgi:carbamoyl-phosphate synthase small subunit
MSKPGVTQETTDRGILLLEDGTAFEGRAIGAPLNRTTGTGGNPEKGSAAGPAGQKDRGYGEVAFNTSLTGYQEILTDPSYYGQIVCMTAAHIGNTGVNAADEEHARPICAGFVMQEDCAHPSSWRSEGGLDEYLKKHGIPGLAEVDTRALTLHLRTRGATRGLLLNADGAKDLAAGDYSAALARFKTLPSFEGRDLINEVTAREPYRWRKPAQTRHRVVALDFGAKRGLFESLTDLGCEIEVVPASTSARDILARKPDGVFLTNGPGDPAAAPYAAETVRELVGKLPLFGVCMGHQILALAMGGRTYKLKFGHRGGNHPVRDQGTGKVEISSHNHGYSVDGHHLPPGAEITHVNLNDQTVEGISFPALKAFSVQYHPEACPGPHDSAALFSRFIDLMGAAKT